MAGFTSGTWAGPSFGAAFEGEVVLASEAAWIATFGASEATLGVSATLGGLVATASVNDLGAGTADLEVTLKATGATVTLGETGEASALPAGFATSGIGIARDGRAVNGAGS